MLQATNNTKYLISIKNKLNQNNEAKALTCITVHPLLILTPSRAKAVVLAVYTSTKPAYVRSLTKYTF